MTPTALRRSALVLLTVLLATLLTAPTAQARPLRDRIPLPDGFQPEGIAISGDHAYFGSRADRRDLQGRPPHRHGAGCSARRSAARRSA